MTRVSLVLNRSLLLLVIPAVTALSPKALGHAYFIHCEGRQTHPVFVSTDGLRLFALNTPAARLSVFDISNASNPEPVLVSEIPVGLEPVSLRQRSPDEVWVVNELSDSISIVSLSLQCVLETLRVPDEPADVVFANGKAFVTCARSNLIRVLDPATRTETGTIVLDGLFPRSMALSADGSRLFVACLLSGNGTSILPAQQAPPPPPPTNPTLPPAPQTGLIVQSGDPRIALTVADHDVAEIDTTTLAFVRWFGGAGTNLFDVAVRPGTSEIWVANTAARNLVRFLPNLRAHAVINQLSRISTPAGSTTAFDLNPDVDYGILPNPSASATALAQPTAIVWDPGGGPFLS
jgi:DNA-binding beta-propeller fold protein YncE